MGQMWTSAEVCELATRFPAEGAAGLAMALGRSVDSICSKAHRYGIRSQTRRVRQGRSRAIGNRTVNARFFDKTDATVAFALGFIWACGSVRTRNRCVLRISCEPHREKKLKHVLSMIGSQHQIQGYGHRIIVEVSNSRLVRTLVWRFGRPSRDDNSDTELPVVTPSLIPAFALGHLDGTGFHDSSIIRWTGNAYVVNKLHHFITEAAEVENPKITRFSHTAHISWAEERSVQRIRRWLAIHRDSYGFEKSADASHPSVSE